MDCPFASEISSPNCEYCHEANSKLRCYKCGFVCYCSNECKIRDQNFHKYECIGYNFFWLNILNVKIELRCLIRCLSFMKKEIFQKFDLSLIRTAEDLSNSLEEHLNLNENYEYSNVYSMDPKYQSMSINDYKSCAKKSLFLTAYLEKHTTILTDFFSGCSNISRNEIKLFCGAIIMKHAGQVKNHKWNIKFAAPEPTKIPKKIHELESVERFLEESLNLKLNENCIEISGEFNEKRIKTEKMNFIQQSELTVYNDRQIVEKFLKTKNLNAFLKKNKEFYVYMPIVYDEVGGDDFLTDFKLPDCSEAKNNNLMLKSEIIYPRLALEMNKIKNNFSASNRKVVLHGLYPTLYQFNHSCNPNLIFE